LKRLRHSYCANQQSPCCEGRCELAKKRRTTKEKVKRTNWGNFFVYFECREGLILRHDFTSYMGHNLLNMFIILNLSVMNLL
jgi:hypothetical protein